MNAEIKYETVNIQRVTELAGLYVETFNAEPWNDKWTVATAAKRLAQMINSEDSYGICAYQNGLLCGAILGCMEQYYDGIVFNIKEFWVNNSLRGQGLGTKIFKEFETRLKDKKIKEIILLTTKGECTEHFYQKQQCTVHDSVVCMGKPL